MTSEDLDGIWQALQQSPVAEGVVYRRLHPESGHDLRAVLDRATASRSLIFERSWRPVDRLPTLVQSRAVTCRATRVQDGAHMSFAVTLVDDGFRDVFSVLTQDVAAAVAAAEDDSSATEAFTSRLEHWRELLRALDEDGLSPTFRRGLFGELHVLADHVLAGLDARTALTGWTGPRRANQDFQYPRLAIEVKTTSGQQPQALVVTNERELDDTGVGSLFLAHVSIDERLGGDGESLNGIVDRLATAVGDDAVAAGLLRMGLALYGYLREHRDRYDEPRYTVRDQAVYAVADDFPRITESSLPSGVGAVRYSVTLAACQQHRVEPAVLTTALQR